MPWRSRRVQLYATALPLLLDTLTGVKQQHFNITANSTVLQPTVSTYKANFQPNSAHLVYPRIQCTACSKQIDETRPAPVAHRTGACRARYTWQSVDQVVDRAPNPGMLLQGLRTASFPHGSSPRATRLAAAPLLGASWSLQAARPPHTWQSSSIYPGQPRPPHTPCGHESKVHHALPTTTRPATPIHRNFEHYTMP